jgi:UDPglucose 6-dehydrogenase
VDLALEAFGGSGSRKNIAALRVTLKSESDNVRDAPALDVAVYLKGPRRRCVPYRPRRHRECGSRIRSSSAPRRRAKPCATLNAWCSSEWHEYRALDPEEPGRLLAGRRIIDRRNVLNPAEWWAAGWQVRGLGRLRPLRRSWLVTS